MRVRRQAGESLLCGKDNRDREKAKRRPDTLEGQTGPVSTADRNILLKHMYGQISTLTVFWRTVFGV